MHDCTENKTIFGGSGYFWDSMWQSPVHENGVRMTKVCKWEKTFVIQRLRKNIQRFSVLVRLFLTHFPTNSFQPFQFSRRKPAAGAGTPPRKSRGSEGVGWKMSKKQSNWYWKLLYAFSKPLYDEGFPYWQTLVIRMTSFEAHFHGPDSDSIPHIVGGMWGWSYHHLYTILSVNAGHVALIRLRAPLSFSLWVCWFHAVVPVLVLHSYASRYCIPASHSIVRYCILASHLRYCIPASEAIVEYQVTNLSRWRFLHCAVSRHGQDCSIRLASYFLTILQTMSAVAVTMIRFYMHHACVLIHAQAHKGNARWTRASQEPAVEAMSRACCWGCLNSQHPLVSTPASPYKTKCGGGDFVADR